MNKTENITACIRCGTCCRKGGPALHKEDKKILLKGHISYHHLITIRKGELAFTPLSSKPEPVKQELVKIAGKGKSWACLFYEKKQSSCAVYEKRPLECRLLKCWDTSDILSITGKGTITRSDLINPADAVMKLIETHEKECPVYETENLISNLSKKTGKSKSLARLTELVCKDMDIRSRAVAEFDLPLSIELFIFGRPLFKLLNSRGIFIREIMGKISLSIDGIR